jgi:single stranded DNA-binding protein
VSATEITVIGNVVSSPSRHRTQNGSSVTNFRLAATERRFDSTAQGWVDGSTFFVDVECWGELGGNVSHSISKGDPVVVVGAIRTDEWESDQGKRSRTRIKAGAVAPNLARGVADFRRTQRAAAAAAEESGSSADTSPEADDVPAEEPFGAALAQDLAGGDYDDESRSLYELDPENSSPQPAHA